MNYLKHRIDGIDKENFTSRWWLLPMEDPSAKVQSTKGDIQILQDQLNAGKEKAMGLFKAVEAYLLANPDTY